jgi:shikimate dehydrogenase
VKKNNNTQKGRKMINAKTTPAFILGNPVEQSLSPVFQNAAFQALKINSVYLALYIETGNFDAVINGLKKLNILGLNVTVPFKLDIMKYCDSLSPEAENIGSVNTIEIKDGKWIGHNTDAYGVVMTLKNNNIDRKLKVFIIGAGGAANAVIYGLKSFGINDITIVNRTMDKAVTLQKQFNIKVEEFTDLEKRSRDYSLIINCTTLKFDSIIHESDDAAVYFDVKYYTPELKTKRYIDGLQMLLYQGARAFTIWTKKEAPLDVMRSALGF